MRARDLARLLPISLLAAITAVAVFDRARTRRQSDATAAHGGGATALVAAPPGSSGPPPLRGPTPPPVADVARGARMLHGDRRHTHRAAAPGPRDARVAWRADVGGPVAAQVVTSPDEQTLYAATLAGDLVALDTSGAPRWKLALGARVYSTPFVDDAGTIHVGTDGKLLYAVSPKGKVDWKLELDGEADSGVTRLDGLLIVAAGATVHAVRPGGDVAWRFRAKGKVFSQPAITADGLLVFGSQDDSVYAIDRAGRERWRVALGADVDSSPCVADDGATYVGTDLGEVVKLDASGKIAWRTQVGGFVRGALAITRSGDVLAGTYGPLPRVVRLSPAGAIVGALAIPGTGAREFGIHGAPLEDAVGTLYFGAQDDRVYAVDTSGALLFAHATGADVDGPLTLLADGTLVVPSEDGTVTALR